MKFTKCAAAAAVLAIGSTLAAPAAQAQAKEQFIPVLSYRTGPYAPNGTPWANGMSTTSSWSTRAAASTA